LGVVTERERDTFPSVERESAGSDELGVAATGKADHLLWDIHTRDPGAALDEATKGTAGAEADLEDVLAGAGGEEIEGGVVGLRGP
jgi:hypothetical protein